MSRTLGLRNEYRRGVLRSEHLDRLEDIFANVCSDFGATLGQYVEAQRRPA